VGRGQVGSRVHVPGSKFGEAINGHIPVGTWNDLREYADFTRDFVAHAEASIKAGKSVDQAAAEYKVAPRYKGYVVTIAEGFVTPKGNLQMAYDELKKQ
jgi:hypothetical protein